MRTLICTPVRFSSRLTYLKCDELRPSCSQCRRGGRICPGYQRRLKFVIEHPSNKTRHDRPSLATEGVCDHYNGESAGTEHNNIKDCEPAEFLTRPKRVATSPPIARLSSHAVTQRQLVSSFVSDFFPIVSSTTRLSYLGSWLWLLLDRCGQHFATDVASHALALAYFAKRSSDQSILIAACQHYSLALRALVLAISDPKLRLDSGTLCAAMLLVHFEVCSFRK
jgi:hypothetical protein